MENLIDRISKIEEATVRVRDSAEEEKKQVDRRMQEITAALDQKIEAETEERLQQIREEYAKKAEEELSLQQRQGQEELSRISAYYEASHEALSDEILRKVIES